MTTFATAQRKHARVIHDFLADCARAGEVLPRPIHEIRHHIADFIVAMDPDNRVIGCVALRDYGKGLFEVRSLVVDEGNRGQGLGSRLVMQCLELAVKRGAHSLFALTYHPDLFTRQGFAVVPKERFPQKVWADCRHCAKQDRCDEIALVIDLTRPTGE
ncbi:MAG: GNAT family N-acetyltransferase [Lentisphaeria bacterium]|nr:GNAT family N-acetyltransferase [Lentisphaeria bacterium]